MPDQEWPLISVYTRKQAIEDGVLIDITEAAKRSGFKLPFAITSNLHQQYVGPPVEVQDIPGQSEEERLARLLNQAWIAACSEKQSNHVVFGMMFLMEPEEFETTNIWLIIDGGDDGQPVLTLMLPEDY